MCCELLIIQYQKGLYFLSKPIRLYIIPSTYSTAKCPKYYRKPKSTKVTLTIIVYLPKYALTTSTDTFFFFIRPLRQTTLWPLSPLRIKPGHQALIRYKALWPISSLNQCIDSLKSRERIKRPTFGHASGQHGVLTHVYLPSHDHETRLKRTQALDLCEKGLEWVPEENSWERGKLLCEIQWYSWNRLW